MNIGNNTISGEAPEVLGDKGSKQANYDESKKGVIVSGGNENNNGATTTGTGLLASAASAT